MEKTIPSEQDMDIFGAELAEMLKALLHETPQVVLLYGTLGAGKTALCRAILRGLTQSPDMTVPSPTFTLVQEYSIDQTPLYHCDLYRLENPDDIFELGWDDMISQGLTLIEWPERLGPYTPEDAIQIHITQMPDQKNSRQITIEGLAQP